MSDDFIVIDNLEVKKRDEEHSLTWHEASTSLTDGWRLPTEYELNSLYSHKDVVGGFSNEYYWSSTEDDSGSAWFQDFGAGFQISGYKSNKLLVRAVRDIKKLGILENDD